MEKWMKTFFDLWKDQKTKKDQKPCGFESLLWCARGGLDLRCGGGRLGLRHAPGMSPRALGFKSP